MSIIMPSAFPRAPNNSQDQDQLWENQVDAIMAALGRAAGFVPFQTVTPGLQVCIGPGAVEAGGTITEIGAFVTATLVASSANATIDNLPSSITAGGVAANMAVIDPVLKNTSRYLQDGTLVTSLTGSALVMTKTALLGGNKVPLIISYITPAFVAPVSNPRIDRLVLTANGTILVVAGSENASPTAPAIPQGCTALGQVYLTVGITALTNQANIGIELASVNFSTPPCVASFRKLAGSGAGGAKTASFTMDEVVAKSALGSNTYLGSGLTLSFAGAGTGANGMDTGSTPTSSSLYIYAIYNPTTNTWACLGTTAGSGASIYGGANMPAGYVGSALMSSVLCDGSANLLAFTQRGNKIFLKTDVNVVSSASGNPTTYTSLAISTAVPANAVTAGGRLGSSNTSAATAIAVAGDSNGTGAVGFGGTTSAIALDSFGQFGYFDDVPLLTSQAIFWKAQATTTPSRINISRYQIPIGGI